ncbi:hypothetical protein BS17DRAFT_28049 [Gyrodon lividus]|nr:hypothetical protein BS17DRAFT_28049 [Gyrodon lividus]
MANIDQAEVWISESSKDGPETANALTSGEATSHNSAQSPVANLYPVKSPISSHSTTPDVPAAPSHPSLASAVSATCTPLSISHPKRFNAVNINKKFLQKNPTSSATTSAASSHVTTVKAGSPAPRPAPQPSGSHSKLVTTKLTSTAQLSTTTGPGWSRPSSATPPVSTTPSSSSNPPPLQQLAPSPAAPQLPHFGKVIQPQPRRAIVSSSSLVKKDSSSTKPAWGNAKSLSVNSFADNTARNDFPTAAEVAQGRVVAKAEEPKAEDTLVPKQVALQEADAFRGVHLDPNAHHWDEMEEDDDNFLDNVIEFGDGRQYKVAPTGIGQPPAATTLQMDGGEHTVIAVDKIPTHPVSKEDRFADDFDRSWPRSKLSPIVMQRDLSSRSSRQASISPTSSQPSHSPMEGSRVLFNERSNRLEPYTSSHFPNRYSSGPGFLRRNAHAEPNHPSAESRFSRDAPPHSPANPVQLLQKPAEGSRDASVPPPRSHDFIGRRQPERDGGPSPFGSHHGQHRARGRDVGGPPAPPFGDARESTEGQPRRFSSISFPSGPIPDGPRQGSLHVTDASFYRGPQPRESPLQPLSVLPAEASTATAKVKVAHPPDVSHSVASGVQPLSATSVLDIEGVHKTAMHISAERAKQRRQLEEEGREKEKERAHRKAAELEERMKRTEAAKKQAQDAAAVEIIQEAVSSPQGLALAFSPPETTSSPPIRSNSIERPPSLKPVARPHRDYKASRSISMSSNEPVPPADQVNSWRSKTRPLPQRPPSPSQLPVSAPPPPLFHSTEELTGVIADENLEVVDFSELGKFVGVEQSRPAPALLSHPTPLHDRPSLPARPVASDFFEDVPPHRNCTGVLEAKIVGSEASAGTSGQQSQVSAFSVFPAMQGMRETDSHRFSATNGALPFAPARSHLSPTGPHHRLSKPPAPFREVPMSALDDVMSRIKGALDNMQVDAGKEASNDSVDWSSHIAKPKVRPSEPSNLARTLQKEARWLPPALRPRRPPQDPDQEVFDVTGCEPPRSPRLNTLTVKLPTTYREIEAIPKLQLHFLKVSSSHVRFDILSWDPPVGGMSRRDLSVNDILFKRPPPMKGNKLRCNVRLPKTKSAPSHSVSAPKVNLPSMFLKTNTPSGRSKAVDDLPTWRRRPIPSSGPQKAAQPEETLPALDATNCSPPPEPSGVLSKLTTVGSEPTKTEIILVRSRTQPKLPAGSAIGFYRDLGSPCPDSKTSVNFTVTSELEEVTHISQPEPSMLLLTSTAGASPVRALSELKESAFGSRAVDEVSTDTQSPGVASSTQVDSKSSEESPERSLRTPASASFSTPWTKSPLSFSNKDSPARAPDPEHLKAVWSQAADKELVPAVNSLEGIADDLTALPFTIQEVKSEDGETPPPTSAAVPSKISLHDVTRAFQQVPPSSNNSSHRPLPLSPSTASGPITRPSGFHYPPPLQPPGVPMRPHYAAFPSAHSPSPTMLYPPPTVPSPIPRVPMNCHPQVYNQHMWVSMQTSQNNAVRPVGSPYPTQMVAYPTSTPVYAGPPSHQAVSAPVSGAAPPRPRGMPVMSPIMHPAAPANVPMYSGSPVLMHPPPMIAPGHRPPYMNSAPPARGQVRSDCVSAAPPMQQPSHSQSQLPLQQVYSHVPFGRPSW